MAPKFPRMYVFKCHLWKQLDKLHEIEKDLGEVYDLKEIRLSIGDLTTKKKAIHELENLGIYTEDVSSPSPATGDKSSSPKSEGDEEARHSTPSLSKKRRKFEDFNPEGKEVILLGTDSETEASLNSDHERRRKRSSAKTQKNAPAKTTRAASSTPLGSEIVKVYRIEWYRDSVKASELLPMKPYLIYEGRIVPNPQAAIPQRKTKLVETASILSRAKEDTPPPPAGQKLFVGGSSRHTKKTRSQTAYLHHEDTSEHERESNLPDLPDFLRTKYSCQRPTSRHGPNEYFLSQLRIINKARIIDGEEKKRHTYQNAIAAIAAYPHTIRSFKEISRLPRCGPKIAQVWHEWIETGHIKEADDILEDPRMQVLNVFYEIYDVGEKRATEFYNNGWKDLDDIIEQGWSRLSRAQQIGVKYYEEFQMRIPRLEVEQIGQIILNHANQLREGFQMVICGGYRRGKSDSGDVDVVLSHPDEDATEDFIRDLLASLEGDDYITHQLRVATRNSNRGQSPLEWKGGMSKSRSGFDTLDSGMVVWQDPDWPSKENDLSQDPSARNPNPHRRVDIIISPWKTAGCAVIGWSGGTTFEMDLRLYCRHELGFKFDSSGIRRIADGTWVDLEAGDGDMLEKEKQVFSGLKLEWREPTDRCTD